MSNPDELNALAGRCEREEPSRELDVDIAAAVACPVGADEGHNFGNSPNYTTSLDAAVTLVPEGLYREQDGPRPFTKIPDAAPNVWRCRITRFRPYADLFGWAATEPLAICAAALRARALSQTDGAEEG
jgi:hypothetical protein